MIVTAVLTSFLTSVAWQDLGAAKERAIEYLLSEQQADGTWVLPGLERYTHAGAAFLGYVLLQAGVPKEHAAIQRLDSLLQQVPARSTYGASTRILFLDALEPNQLLERLEPLAEYLSPPRREYFGYRMLGSTKHGDLSNHQFALLALEVATRHGLGPGQKEWISASEFLIAQQASHGGWDYFAGKFARHPSMTLAGAACLAACKSALLSLDTPQPKLREIDRSMDKAMKSIERDWFLDQPRTHAPLKRWIHYANATLERISALRQSDLIGERDWYEEVSRFLLDTQKPNGTWSSGNGEPTLNTGLALATLSRATASTGGSTRSTWVPQWVLQNEKVKLIASGTKPCTAFLVASAELGKISEVRWWLDDKELGMGRGSRGAIQFPLHENGTHHLRATIELVDQSNWESEILTLTVRGKYDRQERESESLRKRSLDLYSESWGVCKASTAVGAGAVWAIDQSLATAWRFKPTDQTPTWKCELTRKVRHRGVLIEFLGGPSGKMRSIPIEDWLELRLDGKRIRGLKWEAKTDGVLCAADRSLTTKQIELRLHPAALPSTHRFPGVAEVRFLAK